MNQINIPYNDLDYKVIRNDNSLYVDKTRYIEELERVGTKFPVLLGPRRFGKSIFVSQLI